MRTARTRGSVRQGWHRGKSTRRTTSSSKSSGTREAQAAHAAQAEAFKPAALAQYKEALQDLNHELGGLSVANIITAALRADAITRAIQSEAAQYPGQPGNSLGPLHHFY